MNLLRLGVALGIFAVLGSGCDSGTDAPTIGGTYRGSATVEGVVITYRMNIPSTTGGSFTWTGAFGYGGSADEAIGGPGSYAYPTLSLTDDGETLTGTVSADGSRLTFTDPESDATLVVTR